MILKEISAVEAGQVREMMQKLADHHNEIASPEFAGIYPTITVEDGVERMRAMLEKGAARLVVLEDGGGYAGYCFSYVEKDIGHLDQLYVDPGYRGGGLGDKLISDALDYFGRSGVRLIDIRVVEGNKAEHFYKKYGFSRRLMIMSKTV